MNLPHLKAVAFSLAASALLSWPAAATAAVPFARLAARRAPEVGAVGGEAADSARHPESTETVHPLAAAPGSDKGQPASPENVPGEEHTGGGMDLEIPFACGSRVVVSQAHGTFSHVGTDRWAWDFRVPEGMPVMAARDGVVRMTRSDSVRGGCDRSFGPDANYVILQHENGLETQYLHFSKVFVQVGQAVKAGTVIGEVGRTGFSCGSHLHFQLQQSREGAWANQSVPARFKGLGDPAAEQEVVSANCNGPSAPRESLQAEAASAENPEL